MRARTHTHTHTHHTLTNSLTHSPISTLARNGAVEDQGYTDLCSVPLWAVGSIAGGPKNTVVVTVSDGNDVAGYHVFQAATDRDAIVENLNAVVDVGVILSNPLPSPMGAGTRGHSFVVVCFGFYFCFVYVLLFR